MVLLYYEHCSNTIRSVHEARKKSPKNVPKTLPKRPPNPSEIDAKNVLFLKHQFFRFWGGYWTSLDRLGSAPGRLLASLGAFLGGFSALLTGSWAALGCSGTPLGRIMAPKGLPGLHFEGPWHVPDWVLEGFGNLFGHPFCRALLLVTKCFSLLQ